MIRGLVNVFSAPLLSSLVALLLFTQACHTPRPAVHSRFDVRSFGATGDGTTKDTVAFQKALDACAARGGDVVVPPGTYLIGSLVMVSHTTLRLEKGAKLLGSPDKEDYPLMQVRWEGRLRQGHRGLIYASGASHIAIVGEGDIEGNAALGNLRNPRGPCIFEPMECRDILLEGFSTRYVRMWAIHPTFCERIVARNLHIRSTRSNGDGIDVDSCRNVRIEHCDIDTGDDAIVLKSGRGTEGAKIGRPTEDVWISDCTLGSSFAGFAIGSEMSGGIRNVHIERCLFTHGANSIFIKSRVGRGGYIENVNGKDLECRANTFLFIDLVARGIQDEEPVPGAEGIAQVRGIRFSNIKADVPTFIDAHLTSPEKPIEGLFISDVTGTCRRALNLANIHGGALSNINLSGYTNPFLTVTNVTGIAIDKIKGP
jgi:polygalacturonase